MAFFPCSYFSYTQKTPARHVTNCAYCSVSDHDRTTCFYLCPKGGDQNGSQNQLYGATIRNNKLPQLLLLNLLFNTEDTTFDFMGHGRNTYSETAPDFKALDTRHRICKPPMLCSDSNNFSEYHRYTENDDPYSYETAAGATAYAEGYGKARIDLTLNRSYSPRA